jgi:hypothetical protein
LPEAGADFLDFCIKPGFLDAICMTIRNNYISIHSTKGLCHPSFKPP